MANLQRQGRLAQEVQKDITELLLTQINDPRVQEVTVTGVDVSGDLQIATIYYSILDSKASEAQKAQEGLEKASGRLRHLLGERLTIYKIPELRFKQDESIRSGDRIEQLLQQINVKKNQ